MKDLAGLALNELDAYADAVIAGEHDGIVGGDVVAPDAPSTMQKILDELSRRTTCPDRNVESVRRLLLQRSEVGAKKYGTTTDAAGLSLEAWLTHLLEELADAAVYTTAALERHRALEAENAELRARIAEMLTNQADLLDRLNIRGVPREFVEKHNIESALLRHAAKVVLRKDLDWNAQSLEEMERFVMGGDGHG